MVRGYTLVRCMLYGFILWASCLGIRRVHNFYLSSPSFVLSCHADCSPLSCTGNKKLRQFFKDRRAENCSPKQFSEELRQLFPCVKKITCTQNNTTQTTVLVHWYKPLFVANNEQIFFENGAYLSRKDCNQTMCAPLPAIFLAPELLMPEMIPSSLAFIKKIPPELFVNYDIVWQAEESIHYKDKRHQQVMVLSSAAIDPRLLLSSWCQDLTSMLAERKPQRKGQKNDWVIDIRFKGQMIVFPGGKGNV